jgi:putative transposase
VETISRRPHVVSPAEEAAINLPERVTVALGDFAGAAKQGLLALSVGLGLAVVGEIFEEEITALVGPRGKHEADRQAYRHGQEPRQLTLGGRRVQVMKPRARTRAGAEVELDSFGLFASRDLLTQAALDRMLAWLSTRRYRRGLEPVGVAAMATAKSSISRRFVAGTKRKLVELFQRDLSQLDILVLFLDGSRPPDTRSWSHWVSMAKASSTRSASGRAAPRTAPCARLYSTIWSGVVSIPIGPAWW